MGRQPGGGAGGAGRDRPRLTRGRDRALVKILSIIKSDEPSHWAPYEAWVRAHGGRDPVWWERAIDQFIHSELLLLKLPVLFLTPRLKRQGEFADSHDQAGAEAACIAEAA